MLKKFLGLIFVILLSSSLFAQNNPSDGVWEYLIVSPATFNDRENLAVPDKWIGRRQGNVGFFQERGIQNEFDRLGKLGWELVGVLPMNSGEQSSINYAKFIFKRRFDAARSQYEAEEQKRLLEELKNKSPQTRTSDVGFIELDQAEFTAKEKETSDKIRANFEQAVRSANIKADISRFEYNTRRKDIYAEITVDGSATLLKDGNKYRLSEAKVFLRQVADELFNKIGLKPVSATEDFFNEHGSFSNRGNVTVRIVVNVSNNERIKNVVSGYITGNWNIQ